MDAEILQLTVKAHWELRKMLNSESEEIRLKACILILDASGHLPKAGKFYDETI